MSHQYNPHFFSPTYKLATERLDDYQDFRLTIDGDKLQLDPPCIYPEGWSKDSWVAAATPIVQNLQGIVDAVKEKVGYNPRAGFCATPRKMGEKLTLGFEFGSEDPDLLKWLKDVFWYDPASSSMLDHFRLRYSYDTSLVWGDSYHSEWYYKSYSGTIIQVRGHYSPDVQVGRATSEEFVKIYVPIRRTLPGRSHYESLMAL